MTMDSFVDSFEYKLIYIFEIRDPAHQGLLKIGDATIRTNEAIDNLPPNSKLLNQAAKKRIKQYTNTAGIEAHLVHTELAVRTVKGKDGKAVLKAFRDHDVHRVLINSNIPKKTLKGSSSREWFSVDVATAKKAIEAVKKNMRNLSGTDAEQFIPIIFRPEQEEAIERTIKQFKTGDRMLWNAKMRFGKTLSALEVVKKMGLSKTIIITHRPVVDSGWYEDFKKIFHDVPGYVYGSKNTGYSISDLLQSGNKFVYFASMQDLRGSDAVGGKYAKNDEVFDTNWDLVIVDEAHEGTTTALGNDVIKRVVKEGNNYATKFLALSGTPFNILGNYENNVYTWDYTMEQQRKAEWDMQHFGDSNPYDELPEMRIYTYDLGNLMKSTAYVELEDKAFNFREFFRTWTGDIQSDHSQMPPDANVGDFVHQNDIVSFLNLITQENEDSDYPYSREEYRSLFRHALWMIPGVREGKALSKLLQNHPVFGSGAFEIVNVAGNGDKDEESDDALERVRNAIRSAGKDGYTITLSCGKLTTGVTVPEWTAVFMLAGSFSTSAANYMQTIFRVQSPCNQNGKIKRSAYVFDFAPDRTLKMVAESVAISSRAGKTGDGDRQALGKFLNYCPVIAIDGTIMKQYDTNRLLQQLKRAYAERAVQNGFDDTNLYNDTLLKLNDLDIEKFNKLKGIIGSSKAQQKTREININDQGFTDEEYEQLDKIRKKNVRERTPEEQAVLEEAKKKRKVKQDAISILRAISIRMPLLIYGADIPMDEDFTLQMFLDNSIVDSASWREFMPTGVTKSIFKNFIQYYDSEVFVAAGRRIRAVAKNADELIPTERVRRIAELFSCFKNPDKETVLTPWRVVNIHMSSHLGGYDFYDEKHNTLLIDQEPRFVDCGQNTIDTLKNTGAHILEINSKTGLYPLYVTYSIYRAKLGQHNEDEFTLDELLRFWDETVQNNIFVICKTPMAKSITRRTLIGFRNMPVNTHYFKDLSNTIQHKQKQFIEKVLKSSYWGKRGGKMVFDAVVGNPPYQEETVQQISDVNGQAPRKSIFQHFQSAADLVTSEITSLIYPGARWIHRSGKGMGQFGYEQINDISLERLDFYPNSGDIFSDVAIADGISIVCKNKKKSSLGFTYVYHRNGDETDIFVNNPGDDLMPLNPQDISIVEKVERFVAGHKYPYLHDRILPRNLFGIESNFVENNPKAVRPLTSNDSIDFRTKIKLFTNDKAGKAGRARWFVADRNIIPTSQQKYISEWQVVVSSANAGGQKRDNQIEIMDEHSAFGRSRVALSSFTTENEATNFYNFAQTYLIRFMFLMTDEALTSLGKKVPDLVDYSDNNTLIDFKGNLNKQLYTLVGLTENEIAYIEGVIDNQRRKTNK